MEICISHLVAGYGDTTVIPDLDLTFPEHRITVLIGPNGCGKSTLLKTIGKILKPVSGVVLLDKKPIASMAAGTLARHLSYLPQSPVAPEGLTVRDLVAYGRYPHRRAFSSLTEDDLAVIEDVLVKTDLAERADDCLEDLSGGQRQRAWIAMTLAQSTGIMIMDEPTAFLDITHQLQILHLLRTLNEERGTTIILVIHELALAAKFAHCLVGMKNGKVLFSGSPKDTITPTTIEALYGVRASIELDSTGCYPLVKDYDLRE